MKARGGKRPGAGRKKTSLMSQMQVQFRVAELINNNPRLSTRAAVRNLVATGELPEKSEDRWVVALTPKKFPKEVATYLKTAPAREGILSNIKPLKKEN